MDREQWIREKVDRNEKKITSQAESSKRWSLQREQMEATDAERERVILERQHNQLKEIGRPIVQASGSFFIDLDVEADGKAGYGSLRSVGAVTPLGETFYREVTPSNAEYVQGMHEFCEEHGLERERLLEEGVPVDQVMYELDLWVEEQSRGKQPVLAAFNAGFDYGWVDLEMTKAGIDPNPFGIAGYCLKSLAMSVPLVQKDKRYNWANTTKSKLPKQLVPQRDFTHHALEDAEWQQELHFAMVGNLYQYKTPKEYRPTAEDLMGW